MRKKLVSLAAVFLILTLTVCAAALTPDDPMLVYAKREVKMIAIDTDASHFPATGIAYNASESEKKDRDAFRIMVNCKTNTVTVYKNDGKGDYSEAVMAMVCSVGSGTPSGSYRTSDKYRWHELFGYSYGQYCTRIVGNILFHSVPYSAMRENALKYEEYNKLGTTASMGCVRLQACDAQWIYENCAAGTRVTFYSSDDPGPLGKPDYIPIDVSSADRGWDPTDPSTANPWRTVRAYTPLWAQDKPEIIGIAK